MSANGMVQRLAALRRHAQAPLAALLVLVMWACTDTSAPRLSERGTRPLAVASPASAPENFTGRYVVRHSDDFERGKGTFDPMLEADDGTMLGLEFGIGHKPNLNPGVRLRVRGVRRGETVDVEDGSAEIDPPDSPFSPYSRVSPFSAPAASLSRTGASLSLSSTTPVVLAPITKRIAVVLFNFSNNTTQPYTPTYAAGIAFGSTNSVADYYRNNSWSSVTIVGNVYGWFTIPDSSGSACPYSTWAASANKVVAAAGIDLSSASYDHIVYAFPSVSACGFSGVAYLPGRTSWLNGSGGMSLRTMGHELGHNFATHHASTLNCTEGGVRVSLSANMSNCTANEYGDPFSIMGSGTRRHTSTSLGNFGWLPGANRFDVTQTGDYQIAPLYASSGYQALRVQRNSSSYLTLEYRQSGPFDVFSAGDPEVNGVTVRVTGSDANRTQSLLVDMTPGTSSFTDAALLVGQTFVDPLTSVSMTTLATSSTAADVRISFAPDEAAPSQPGNFKATALDPYRIGLSWTTSTDNIGVAGYRITRNGTLVGTVTGTGYTDAGLSPSTAYNYQVAAFDAGGNSSTGASASATTLTPDVAPPAAPTGLTATVSKGSKVALSWKASTDDVGVAGYRVYKNGQLKATVTGTGYSDSLGGGKNPSASYYVVAFDAAGNVSAPSNTVSVGQ